MPTPRLSNRQVERRAMQILRDSGQLHAPVELEQVAKHLKIGVEYVNFDEACCGVLVKSQDGTAVIGVNREHHFNRQRFTIAHEIGHFVLKHDGDTFIDKGTYASFRDDDSRTGNVMEERQANQFAAMLLMPARLVEALVAGGFEERLLDPVDNSALQDLANIFQVSTQAMMFRVQNMGLIKRAKRPF